MGWSCSSKAGNVMRAMFDKCFAQSKFNNVFIVRETRYMLEISDKEHDDGAITGKVLKFITYDETTGNGTCRPVGSIRIEPDGKITRAPSFLRELDNLS